MDAKKALLMKRKKLVLSSESALNTGSTLLNLACTDHPNYGFIKGGYYYIVGDSTSGKTWLILSCFAEAARNPAFNKYELIFDDVEGGAQMDVEHYFGKKVAQRIRWVSSETVQDHYRLMHDLIKAGRPFIMATDSQDALDSEYAEKKFGKQKKAAEEGQEAKGSFGDGKAKYHSENIRWVLSGLKRTGSIELMIGQTRDNLQPFSFEKKTRSGGKALRFYSSIEIWTSLGKKIKKKVRGKDKTVGINCIAEVRKNRITGKVGKDRSVVIPIYNGFGIDDVGALVDFLIAENHFTKKKVDGATQYYAECFKFRGKRSELINYIEQTNQEEKLKEEAARVWREIEDECQLVNRKKRYE